MHEQPTGCDALLCGVCLEERPQEIGALDACQHIFCWECVSRWADIESRCPSCKQRFAAITRKRLTPDAAVLAAALEAQGGVVDARQLPGQVLEVVAVEEKNQRYVDDGAALVDESSSGGEDADDICMVCGGDEDDAHLLICDTHDCPNLAHTYCVGLGDVPEHEWHCPHCAALRTASPPRPAGRAAAARGARTRRSARLRAERTRDVEARRQGEADAPAAGSQRRRTPAALRISGGRRSGRARALSTGGFAGMVQEILEDVQAGESREARRRQDRQTAAATLQQRQAQRRIAELRGRWRDLRQGVDSFTATGQRGLAEQAAPSGAPSGDGGAAAPARQPPGSEAALRRAAAVMAERRAAAAGAGSSSHSADTPDADVEAAWKALPQARAISGAGASSSGGAGTGGRSGGNGREQALASFRERRIRENRARRGRAGAGSDDGDDAARALPRGPSGAPASALPGARRLTGPEAFTQQLAMLRGSPQRASAAPAATQSAVLSSAASAATQSAVLRSVTQGAHDTAQCGRGPDGPSSSAGATLAACEPVADGSRVVATATRVPRDAAAPQPSEVEVPAGGAGVGGISYGSNGGGSVPRQKAVKEAACREVKAMLKPLLASRHISRDQFKSAAEASTRSLYRCWLPKDARGGMDVADRIGNADDVSRAVRDALQALGVPALHL